MTNRCNTSNADLKSFFHRLKSKNNHWNDLVN